MGAVNEDNDESALDCVSRPLMAHTYSVRTFDETGLVVRGGVAAAYEAAASTLATVVPPDHRLIQLIETGRNEEVDAVTVSFAALIESV